MFDDCLIMAGGSGTRLWPASSSKKPKQFLPVGKDQTKTFFSLSLERAFQVIKEDSGRVIVIAGKTHMPLVVAECAALSAAEKKRLVLIPEPLAKNTAPAIACALAYSGKTRGRGGNMLVLTSDHVIGPPESFKNDATLASQHAAGGRLVVFGITPSRPETGYGYIETAGKAAGGAYTVVKFQEKPDLETAKKLIVSRRHFWNSGMFAFDRTFLEKEFKRLAAAVIRPFGRLNAPDGKSYTRTKGLRVLSNWEGLEEAYGRTKNISFDYAIAVNCERAVMVRSSFDWIDVGSWDEYARLQSGGNIADTGVYTTEATGCFVDSDIPVALVGVEDLIVVIRSGTDGLPRAALVTRKGKSQQMRDIVEQIKKAGETEIL